MFIQIALPVTDVRGMVGNATGRTSVPFWLDPEHRDEFVRGMGALRPRPRRGVTPWAGESYFIDAQRGVRFPPSGGPPDGRRLLRPVYRRFYSDGVVGRLEVAFRSTTRGGDGTGRPDLVEVAAMTPVCWREGQQEAVPLVRFGPDLATAVLAATTATGRRPPTVPRWWVSAGHPMVLTEQAAPGTTVPSGTTVEQRWKPVQDERVSTWSLGVQGSTPWDEARRLRVHVVRCHCEIEATRTVLRLCAQERLDPADPALADFLDARTSFLLRRTFAGFAEKELLQQVLDSVGDAYSDELVGIDTLSRRFSRGLAGKLRDLGDVMLNAPRTAAGPTIIISVGGHLTMNETNNDNSVNLTNSTAGAVQGGAGNTQTTGDITVSVGSDLSALVKELAAALGGIRGQLAPEVSAEADDLVAAVEAEAAKETPDKGRLGRWLDKLQTWGEAVGEVAAPVLKVAGAIVKILV